MTFSLELQNLNPILLVVKYYTSCKAYPMLLVGFSGHKFLLSSLKQLMIKFTTTRLNIDYGEKQPQ